MRYGFELKMEAVVIDGTRYDEVIIAWEDDMDQATMLSITHEWCWNRNYLGSRMRGLEKVGESSLTIQPLEEAA